MVRQSTGAPPTPAPMAVPRKISTWKKQGSNDQKYGESGERTVLQTGRHGSVAGASERDAPDGAECCEVEEGGGARQ